MNGKIEDEREIRVDGAKARAGCDRPSVGRTPLEL